jgi:hypothetical protein
MVIKIDFSRIFPGLIILLIGLGLFAVWVIMALASFFLFFIPGLQGAFFATLGILVVSLVLVGLGILVMVTGVSGWWNPQASSGDDWLTGVVDRRIGKDRVRLSEKAGELVGLLFSFLVLLFFIANQAWGTGFFTSRFGPLEQALFYGTWVFSAAVVIARVSMGRRNAVRPLEVLSDGATALTAFWLIYVFPFNFTHFTDLFPSVLRGGFLWVTDPIGGLAIFLVGMGSLVGLVYTSILYAAVRARLLRSTTLNLSSNR